MEREAVFIRECDAAAAGKSGSGGTESMRLGWRQTLRVARKAVEESVLHGDFSTGGRTGADYLDFRLFAPGWSGRG
jgi:hypothetical protein